MTTMRLTGHSLGYWEERLAKEKAAASTMRGLPHRDHSQLVDLLHDRGLLPDPPSNYATAGAPVVLSKGRAGYAWRDYSQGHNPVAGFNTRWLHYDDSPFYLARSASASTDAFPMAPRMEGAMQSARSTAQLYSQTALPPDSPETWRSLRNSPSSPTRTGPSSPTRTGRRFYSPTARPEPGTLNHLLSPPVIDPVLGASPEPVAGSAVPKRAFSSYCDYLVKATAA